MRATTEPTDPTRPAEGGPGAANRSHVEYSSNPLYALREGRLVRRFTQLFVGLVLYGVSMTMMIRAGLGLDPWDVFHQGIVEHTPLSFGTVVIITSFVVLIAWAPLRQWPGIGTVCNAIVIGLVTDASLALTSSPKALWARVLLMVGAVVLNAFATALYIGARFGPGPRDGLMTGLVRRTGRSIRLIRTSIEVTVLVVGWLMGGTFGVGTVLYAVGIGPLVHLLLPPFVVRPKASRAREVAPPDPGASLPA